MSRRVRLLVFDWDGTLADSIGHIVASMTEAMREIGLPQRPEEDIRDIIGLGLADATARLFPGLDSPALRRSLAAAYRRCYYAAAPDGALLPGAEASLRRLRDRGYRLAVATGKSRDGLDRVLAQTGAGAMFEVTRCADEGRPKPDPDMLRYILGATRCAPSEALMIGDSEHDLRMAGRAGIDAVGVCSGAHGRDVLQRCHPLACLASVAELPEWLARGAVSPR